MATYTIEEKGNILDHFNPSSRVRDVIGSYQDEKRIILAGGAVRDFLLGKEIKDFDFFVWIPAFNPHAS